MNGIRLEIPRPTLTQFQVFEHLNLNLILAAHKNFSNMFLFSFDSLLFRPTLYPRDYNCSPIFREDSLFSSRPKAVSVNHGPLRSDTITHSATLQLYIQKYFIY
jgi:hypothetical protein